MKQLIGEDMEAYALRRKEELNNEQRYRVIRFRKSASSTINIFDNADFVLPLLDLGNGAVNTVLARGTGSATYTRATTAWTKLASGLWRSVASGTARSAYIGLNTAVSAYGGYFAEGAGTQLVTPTASIRDMTDASVQAKFTDEQALKAMKEGVKDTGGKVAMKPIENVSEGDMKALVGHVRTLKK